ncbi:MAG TPA: hypothetical protein VED24_00520 [Candidatus Acidoferrum sp.]|nr:hypothetical protein [Candidatus Acidoferrum sp.]
MNSRYLPVIAALLIAVTCSAFLPVIAQSSTLPTLPTTIFAAPTLTVVTIAQDDQARHTGVMWLADTFADFGTPSAVPNLVSQYKLLISYNGVPVVPSSIYCQFVEKDKAEPLKNRQGTWETLESIPNDVSSSFVCKFRSAEPGVGVLDVYFTGAGKPVSIADYVLFVSVSYTVGRSTVYGGDMQDLCLLGWPVYFAPGAIGIPVTSPAFNLMTTAPLPAKSLNYPHGIYVDPLGNWGSCEDLALQEQAALGLPISWT